MTQQMLSYPQNPPIWQQSIICRSMQLRIEHLVGGHSWISADNYGLWLQPDALWQRNAAALLAVLQEGLASPEHTAFVKQFS